MVDLIERVGEPGLARSGAIAEFTAGRANLVDRNGALVATSLATASLSADPGVVLDPERAAELSRELGARHVATLEQRDTYYETEAGRLKRRECGGRETEWIAYSRGDSSSARATAAQRARS